MTIIADQIITPLSFVGSDFTAINLFLRLLSFFFLLLLISMHAVRKPTSDQLQHHHHYHLVIHLFIRAILCRLTEWLDSGQHPRPQSFVGDDKWPLPYKNPRPRGSSWLWTTRSHYLSVQNGLIIHFNTCSTVSFWQITMTMDSSSHLTLQSVPIKDASR